MEQIRIVEVGPRDGFQNIKQLISFEDKLQTIRLLRQAGVQQMEIGSFVNPAAIPQMADIKQLCVQVLQEKDPDFTPIALIPNMRGAQDAVTCGLDTVTYVTSVSEKHNLANVRKTPEQSIEALGEIIKMFPQLRIRLDLATSFGCSIEGEILPERVIALADRAAELGVREFILCDTIGVAAPNQVEQLSKMMFERFPGCTVGMHLHDTRGLGVANIYAAYLCGVRVFETSVGGLGGCPFAPGAAGNTATEDLLYLTNRMDIETGISWQKYLEAVQYVKTHIEPRLTGRQIDTCTLSAFQYGN